MKRLFLAGLMFLVMASSVWSASVMIPSITQTASAAILSMRGYFHGITVMTDGTNTTTVDVYDNTAGSGRKLIPTWIVPSSATNRAQTYNLSPPVPVSKGIYVVVSVAGAGTCSYMAYYSN
jgi:hypothetical protein